MKKSATPLCRALALLLVIYCLIPLASAKPKPSIKDLRFNYSLENPGVSVQVIRDGIAKKKTKGKEVPPRFYVNGRKTHAVPETDSTYFVYINSMRRWSVKSPITYAVTMALGEDSLTRQFGICQLSCEEGKVGLSDTAIVRKGLTEAALPLKSAVTEDDWRRFFLEIKKKGFTVVSLAQSSISKEMIYAADHCGILVHARILPRLSTPVEDNGGKKKKKSKKSAPVETAPLNLEETYREHPALCMVTVEEGAQVEVGDRILQAQHFSPTLDKDAPYTQDYSASVNHTGVCIADFSALTDEETLKKCLEKTLCTPGVGILLFSSVDQAKVWKNFMMLGAFDRDEWDSSMSMSMKLFIANNSEEDYHSSHFSWKFTDDTGFVFSDGQENGHRFLPFSTNYVETAFSPMANVFPGTLVTLTMKMEDTGYQRTWMHRIQYPPRMRYMNEEVHRRMKDWCRRGASETDLDYTSRVNEVTKSRKRRLFAYDIITEEAGDLVKGKAIKLSRYNHYDETVEVTVDGLPSFKLKVPHEYAEHFNTGNEESIALRNIRYGLTNKDEYEIAYAEVFNMQTGESCLFENFDNEEALARMFIDDKYVPEEARELAERENKILQDVKQRVLQNAKDQHLITDHTKLDVKAHVVSDYDEKGNIRNNYQIVFEYNVDERYSLDEDYGPGRYHIEDSHAAISMLRTITAAFGENFSRYIAPNKKLDVTITGSADSSPIRGTIAYDGCYGEFENEPYYLGEKENVINITQQDGIHFNEQLAYLRAQGVHDFLLHNLNQTDKMKVRYLHNIELPKGRGGKFRRIKICFSFIDAF